MPSIRNIIIFVSIAAAMILAYVFFLKPSSPETNLISSPGAIMPEGEISGENAIGASSPLAEKNFLALLLSVKNIKLNDKIFSDPAFLNLEDSSIVLTPDGNEGRPNPFAQLGSDIVSNPSTLESSSVEDSTNSEVFDAEAPVVPPSGNSSAPTAPVKPSTPTAPGKPTVPATPPLPPSPIPNPIPTGTR